MLIDKQIDKQILREINDLIRKVDIMGKGKTDAYVWLFYNSGDPILEFCNPNAPECMVFADKDAAIDFIRGLLKYKFGKDTDGLSDDQVEATMWNNDEDIYLHLYEMRVHDADCWMITGPA